jgi:hypothetical protein
MFVSGYSDTVALDGMMGAVVLRKPFDMRALDRALSSVLHCAGNGPARTAVSDAVAAGQDRGELPQGDPVKLGWLLVSCAYGATIRALAEPQFKNARESVQAEMLIDELFSYLRGGDGQLAT